MSGQPDTARTVFLLMGPTGSGKSGLAVALGRRLPIEIINCDSMQVYRGMDIGTAKPSAAERAAVPHHLFDLQDPDQEMNAGIYAGHADRVIAELLSAGRLPLLVGGTGLWARAVLFGVAPMPPVPEHVRQEVRDQMRERGPQVLHAELARVDPAAAARLHPNDSQRISRALEVFRASGRPISELQAAHGFSSPRYQFRYFGLRRGREELKQRISQRADAMIAGGFAQEARTLLAAGYSRDLRAFKALGYREVFAALDRGGVDASTRAAIINSHWAYAKRQMTWFNGEKSLRWVDADGSEEDRILRELEAATRL